MLDIKFIRENKELIQAGAQKKRMEFDVEKLLSVDTIRRELVTSVEGRKADQNKVSQQITVETDAEKRNALIEEMRTLKDSIKADEERLAEVMKEWQLQMVSVPNIPDMSVPEGESDADNVEVKKWGDAQTFPFEAKSHIDIMEELDLADFKKGTDVSGFRGYFLKNGAAELSLAIWMYARDFWTKKGFSFMIVPSLVRRETLFGTGYLPQGEEDLYKTQDGDFLAGTAEVATMAYFADTEIPKNELPKKVLAFSPCFRREAGSHGKDVKGLIRVHEFFKMEQVVLCEASHEESVKLHEEINRNTEEFIESLGIPYHTVVNCGGDLGLGQVKKYDIELWVPGEQKYREISSASYFHDFQARRLNIKYRDEENKSRFVHSLNCTAIPTPRILVSLIENYQQEDGTIRLPEILRPYMANKEVIGK
ncbi:MAG TPA: serine--tRNA ligase [Candidatus Paceibacterota bacterium]